MQVFVSYAHADHKCCEKFLTHVGALKFDPGLVFWHDKSILAGSRWTDEIAKNIEASSIFLLLFTPQFLKSTYILETEIPAIKEKRKTSGALVIPVVIEQCQWEVANTLQAVPTDEKGIMPILDWKPQRNGFNRAREQLATAIKAHFGLPSKKLFEDTP